MRGCSSQDERLLQPGRSGDRGALLSACDEAGRQPDSSADVRRFTPHTGESLGIHLSDPFEPLVTVASRRQGFRQKQEVVSLLRRSGYGAIAPEALSDELKGMVNRKKLALVAAGESRRPIPSTAAIQEWLNQVVATYGLRPHEVWHIEGLPDKAIGVAARHIKVTKTGIRVALPLPAEWLERYQPAGANGMHRLEQLRARYQPTFVNEEGLPFDPERDLVKRCDNNERLGAVYFHIPAAQLSLAGLITSSLHQRWLESFLAAGKPGLIQHRSPDHRAQWLAAGAPTL